jgi:hypothetical protein
MYYGWSTCAVGVIFKLGENNTIWGTNQASLTPERERVNV